MGLPQVASFKMLLGATAPTQKSLDIMGRSRIVVDRIAAKLIVNPSALGALPTMDQVRAAERLVRFRLALDQNDARVLTIGDQAVSTFSQLDQGPVPVAPFPLNGNEQPTVKVSITPNLFQNAVFTAFGTVELELVLWGQEA
jgi:hypothetical protein